MTGRRDDRFAASQRQAQATDTMSWPLAAAYLCAFFGSMLAAHLWPQPWWGG
jgi:hypothetical protein